MGEVSIIYKRSIPSSKPLKPGKKIELSPLDTLMEKHSIKMVYYYSTPEGFCDGEITRRLRESLSEVLTYFHNVTGRLMKGENGKWEIKCNDSGVRIVEAKAKGSVENWLGNIVDDQNEMTLIEWSHMFYIPYYWATTYFQVTEFEEGGLAVSLACSHLLADPLSASLFIKAWADMALYGKLLVPPFFHPLPRIILGQKAHKAQPNTYLINHYKSILENPSPSPSTPRKSHTISLAFTGEMVKACMSLAQLINEPEPTPFTALAGLLWACISRVRGSNGLIDMSLCIDVRKILGLDKGYFGNCMVYSKLDGKSIGVDESLGAIRLIEKAIERVNKEGIMDLIEWLENKSTPRVLLTEGIPVIMNMENMDCYSTVFVEGSEPIRVSCYVQPLIGHDKVFVFPSHPREDKLSRVVVVTLPDDEVFKLCEDKLLTRFSPTIQMSPNTRLI